jgi:hypothetical protein
MTTRRSLHAVCAVHGKSVYAMSSSEWMAHGTTEPLIVN